MKTDKKSRVPLFTFPPPLLAELFLLAGCHYKALQGMVWAIGVGHGARWRSPMFQTPWYAHSLTHSHSLIVVTHALRETRTRVHRRHRRLHAHQRKHSVVQTGFRRNTGTRRKIQKSYRVGNPHIPTFYRGRCIIQAPAGGRGAWRGLVRLVRTDDDRRMSETWEGWASQMLFTHLL